MATPFSILAWKIPWTEVHGGLQSVGPKTDRVKKICSFVKSLSGKSHIYHPYQNKNNGFISNDEYQKT